jgi:hypothetical protein
LTRKAPGRLTLGEEDRRALAPWAADCAERTLPVFEAAAPDDRRPRAAIEGVRAFARGELKIGPVRALSAAAHAAARDVDDPAATAAARAAGHAAGTAHMAAHARGVPAYAALARTLAGPDDPDGAIASEVGLALGHASPDVLAALRRLPPPLRASGVLGEAISALDARLRES